MSTPTPRLRVFAGPNGSGKSTLKAVLPPALLGAYINPDEIESAIRREGSLDLASYGVFPSAEDIKRVLDRRLRWHAAGAPRAMRDIAVTNGQLRVVPDHANAYLASEVAEFLRQCLVAQRASFTFETVMSHPSKVALLAQAQAAGYRTYLYYVATDDPAINISRVRARVRLGGHAVPEDKIAPRYHRSLGLLLDAIRNTNRAYIFDNSSDNADRIWLAEITDGRTLELKTDQIPAWFRRAVLDRIQ